MPRFYFHIREGSIRIEDSEGIDLDDPDDVEREAREGARSIADPAKIDAQRFEVANERGEIVLIYPFRRAFER